MKRFKLNVKEQKQAVLLKSVDRYTNILAESDNKILEINETIGLVLQDPHYHN